MRAVELAAGHSAAEFRALAKGAKDANQARRLLALAAVRDGVSRTKSAAAGGMDLQTLCDWVHAYNDKGISGLINATSTGRPHRLNPAQQAEIKTLVENGPDPVTDGVVRWRRSDLVRIVKQKYGVSVDEDTIGRLLRRLGFSHISARPLHPDQRPGAVEDFKKKSRKSLPPR